MEAPRCKLLDFNVGDVATGRTGNVSVSGLGEP